MGYKTTSVYSDQILVTSEDITGIADIKSKIGINLYPNPVNDILNIELLSTSSEDIEFNILNISGQIIYKESQTINNGINNFRIDVSSYPGGMYFVHVTGNKMLETLRFIK